MINNKSDVIFQLFKHEEALNGYYHLVQKKLHGTDTKRPYVGLKSYHIQNALDINIPIMVHLCPNVNLDCSSLEKIKNLKNCNYADQCEAMIIKVEDFFRFRTTNMQESKARDEEGNLKLFTQGYEVWHYIWKPDYVEGKGVIKKELSSEQLGLF